MADKQFNSVIKKRYRRKSNTPWQGSIASRLRPSRRKRYESAGDWDGSIKSLMNRYRNPLTRKKRYEAQDRYDWRDILDQWRERW